MHTYSPMLAVIILALGACNQSAAGAQSVDPLASVRAQVLAHAPYKQWNLATGEPNRAIGRTPGAACEAISFLAADARRTGNVQSRKAATGLADWIVSLQDSGRRLPISGGVPSTPDLAPPSNAYHYSIDAAFCGSAMLDMAELTGDKRFERSGQKFGAFLLTMMRNSGETRTSASPRGLCEYVVQLPGQKPAWDCRRFVKNLVALPLLRRLHRLQPAQGYSIAAQSLRAALLPGLEGLWEYAEDGSTGRTTWKRISGPKGEKDLFVYGDTLAYALRGLHAYEGPSPTVRRLYSRFAGMKGRSPWVTGYDGRVALAGYILADEEGPDPFSAYYDTVTLGLLQPVRRDVAPADAQLADEVLRREIAPSRKIGWHMDMERRPGRSGMGDISTLAALGSALVNH